jgi:hypothetical protein
MFTTGELFGKFHSPRKPFRSTLGSLRRHTLHQMETLCDAWIPTQRLAPNLAGPNSRERIYTPKLTFLTFLSQVLNPGASCRKAALEVKNYYLLQPQPIHVSQDNSPYCQARARLDLDNLSAIRAALTQRMAQALPSGQGLCPRPVKVVDGTCLTMPDTPKNQAAYPQPSWKKPGCGFPQMRLLALFSLDTGALLERARGQYTTSEVRLFRNFWPLLDRGDILLGDRIFGFYYAMAELTRRGVDGIFALNVQRDQDFRRGKRLGKHDRLVTWDKPRSKPKGLTDEQWALVPAQMVVREVKIKTNDPSCRVRQVVLCTTLLDHKKWPKAKLGELLKHRWQVELNLDDLKTTLQMDVLSCRKPAMIHRELEMHLIAYNLNRAIMLEASVSCHAPLYRLSFKGTLDTVQEFSKSMVRVAYSQKKKRQAIYMEMLSTIAADLVPERPGRREPRCLKRRSKPYPFMTKPRRRMKDEPKPSRRKKKTTPIP